MLPNEAFRVAPPAKVVGSGSGGTVAAAGGTKGTSAAMGNVTAASDMSSMLARPHSRMQQPALHKEVGTTAVETHVTRAWSPPRLKHETQAADRSRANLSPTRSRSPQQTVRTIGNAIVNPRTVFTSSVATSMHTTQIALPSSSDDTGVRVGSPPRGGGAGAATTTQANQSSILHLSSIHVSQANMSGSSSSAVVTTNPVNHNASQLSQATRRDTRQTEVYGMTALRRGYGTTSDHTTSCEDGCRVEELLPLELPAPDLKKLDLGCQVPRYSADSLLVPRICFLGNAEVSVKIPFQHSPAGLPVSNALSETSAETAGASSRAAGIPFSFPHFVARIVDVAETGLDRAITFHVTTEVPELFSVQPYVDAESGTLHFTPNPLASGVARCHVKAVDNAMVDAQTTAPLCSLPLSFTITVARVKDGATPTSPLSSSEATAARAAGRANSPERTQHRVTLATRGDFASTLPAEELLRLGHEALVVESGGGGGASSEGNGSAPPPFVFPAANPHQLRYPDAVHINNLWIAQHQSSNDGIRPATMYQPCFDSLLTDLELVRLGRSAQERDRLLGEHVKEETRAELEAKLSERIRQEEKRIGVDSVDLCPLLLRLAQIHMSQGAKLQGSAVELLERISRIRLRQLGVQHFEDIDALASQLHGSLNMSVGGKGGGVNDILGSSMLSSAASALDMQASADGSGSFASPTSSASIDALTKDSKKFDGMHQSLMLLTLYLRSIGRYREMLDFGTYALKAAEMVQGDGSLSHLRSMSEVAEAHLLLGNYKEARPLLERCIARAEVLFGADAPATHNLVHTFGICCAEERDYNKAMSAHDRVLRSRQKRHEPSEQMSLAESYLLACVARVGSGNRSPATAERIAEYHEHAIGILLAMDVGSLTSFLIVGRAGLLALAGRICQYRGDTERCLQLLQRASDDVSSARGFDSVDAALIAVPFAAARLSRHCEGYTAPPEKMSRSGAVKQQEPRVSAEAEEVASSVSSLQFANSTLLTVLGHQHPYTLRCSALVAEVRMYQNPQQSAQMLERCLACIRKLLHGNHQDQVVVHHISAKVHLVLREYKIALVEAATAHAVALDLNEGDARMIALETTLLGAMTGANETPSTSLVALLDHRVKSCSVDHGETSDTLVEPLQNLAEAHFLLSDFPKAHHYLSRAIKIADAVNFIFLLGHLLKPVAQLSVSDVQERNRIARDRIHTNLALRFAEILFQIASVFDTEGKTEDAQSTYLQALAAQEISGIQSGLSVVETLRALACLLYSEGHFGDALAYTEKAHSMLLENFSTMRPAIDAVCDVLRIINFRLRCNGYALLRHPDSRHRFTTYV